MKRKLPIGIQSFESMRRDGYVYVDKTAFVWKLATEGKPYFLGRPRRFGKSLLISTLKAYFEGRRELFCGLALERLEEEGAAAEGREAWLRHPVFHFDFNPGEYDDAGALRLFIDDRLKAYEREWGVTCASPRPDLLLGSRLLDLLKAAHARTGLSCVVLVDEYDKPLLGAKALADSELEERNRAILKAFYGSLKSADDDLRLAFLTGVTKFSKVSIFSDLNQLRDITMEQEFAGACGVTEAELRRDFAPEVDAMAARMGTSREGCLAALRAQYDGYRFHPEGPDVYNPFSLVNALAKGEIGSYWFATGTPTFLVERMRDSGLDPRSLADGSIWATEARLSDYRADDPDPIPLLFQAGYLTIRGFQERGRRYELCVPNAEVEYGLVERLLPAYAPACATARGTDVFSLLDRVETGDAEGVRNILTALFASIPYTGARDPFENYFQAVVWLVFTLMGQYVTCELHQAQGRADCVVEAEGHVWVFEFKRDGTAAEALAQIAEKGYAKPYAADPRELHLVGCAFDSATRTLADWECC